MRTYKLTDVRKVCEVIYGRKITDRTWRNWKNRLAFCDYAREISKENMEQLLVFANMKRARPYDKITLKNVVENKLQTLKEFQENKLSYQIHLLPDSCKGEEIIKFIKLVTGRDISERTLRRWIKYSLGESYLTNRNYRKNELLSVLSAKT